MKREAEAPQEGAWSADQEGLARPTSPVYQGARRNLSEEEARVRGLAEKHEISKHMVLQSKQGG